MLQLAGQGAGPGEAGRHKQGEEAGHACGGGCAVGEKAGTAGCGQEVREVQVALVPQLSRQVAPLRYLGYARVLQE